MSASVVGGKVVIRSLIVANICGLWSMIYGLWSLGLTIDSNTVLLLLLLLLPYLSLGGIR